MDWFKYIWLIILIIIYIIWTVCAIKDVVDYIKIYGFIQGLEYASIFSNWFDIWITAHAVILIGIILTSFIYFLINL